jgi:hypothetical protein
MKQLSFSIVLLATVLLTGSCKKVVLSNWSNAKISFKLDGAPKEASGDKNIFALYAKEQGIIQIAGAIGASGEQQIGLTIGNFHGVGTYSAEEDFLASYNIPGADATIIGTEGSIKITEFIEGKSIKGEFHFTGQEFIINVGTEPDEPGATRVFTDGKFEAKVSSYSGPIISP